MHVNVGSIISLKYVMFRITWNDFEDSYVSSVWNSKVKSLRLDLYRLVKGPSPRRSKSSYIYVCVLKQPKPSSG